MCVLGVVSSIYFLEYCCKSIVFSSGGFYLTGLVVFSLEGFLFKFSILIIGSWIFCLWWLLCLAILSGIPIEFAQGWKKKKVIPLYVIISIDYFSITWKGLNCFRFESLHFALSIWINKCEICVRYMKWNARLSGQACQG